MSGGFSACLWAGAARWPASAESVGLGWLEAGEEREIVGHGRGPDVGLEVIQPLPGAAAEPVGPLQAGDVGLDPGPEVARPSLFTDRKPRLGLRCRRQLARWRNARIGSKRQQLSLPSGKSGLNTLSSFVISAFAQRDQQPERRLCPESGRTQVALGYFCL